MIHIYGDSHARYNFNGLIFPHRNHSVNSTTMHRVGRDKKIIGFSPDQLSADNIFVLQYGEIDCRCHINRQYKLGRDVHEICDSIVKEYINSIIVNITTYKAIIVCAVIPPTCQKEYEDINGPITHEFPFVGNDIERISYTNMINEYLMLYCKQHNFIFFDPYDSYKRLDGTLRFELSDKTVHIQQNEPILDMFNKLIATIRE